MSCKSSIDKQRLRGRIEYQLKTDRGDGVRHLEPARDSIQLTEGTIEFKSREVRYTSNGREVSSNVVLYTAKSFNPDDKVRYKGSTQWYIVEGTLQSPNRITKLYCFLINKC